jgi:predicted amidophosphoribosyltransferase
MARLDEIIKDNAVFAQGSCGGCGGPTNDGLCWRCRGDADASAYAGAGFCDGCGKPTDGSLCADCAKPNAYGGNAEYL